MRFEEISLNYEIQLDEFICCPGFEDRALGVLNSHSIIAKNSPIILQYSEFGRNFPITRKSNHRHFDKVSKLLSRYGKSPQILELHGLNNISVISSIINDFRSRHGDNHFTLGVDISTMNKVLQIQLIYYLVRSFNNSEIFVFYVEPSEYGNRLTAGVSSIFSIPPFNGGTLSSRRDLLVEFLSMAPDRNQFIIENLEFDKILVWTPETDEKRKIRDEDYEKANIFLNSVEMVEKRSTSLVDPNRVMNSFLNSNIIDTDLYNLYIVPNGSKMQTLGVTMYILEKKVFPILLYPVPYEYVKDFSNGIGTTHVGKLLLDAD